MKKALMWGPAALIFAVIFYFNRESGVLIGTSLIFILSFITERDKIWAWIPALTISWLWVYAAKDIYSSYNVFKYSVYGVSIFPIAAWPTLLMVMYFLFLTRINGRNRWRKWLKFSITYSICIILFEYLGYNFAGVHLASGTVYAGWPILNIFHCPWWVQAAYFLNGIIFCGVIAFFSDRKLTWNYISEQVRQKFSTPAD